MFIYTLAVHNTLIDSFWHAALFSPLKGMNVHLIQILQEHLKFCMDLSRLS